jgi:subunit length determinant Wzz-like protein
MKSDSRNDEIDLIEVFFNIYKFFKKNILILITSVIIGTALGYSYTFFAKEYYKSEMLTESYTISEELRINYIKQFQSLLDDKNYEILKSKTGLEVGDLKKIKEISFETDGNNKDENILFIRSMVWDTTVLPKLAEGIQSYMNSFPYVKDEIELFNEKNESLINDINVFIIDSINPSERNYYVNDEGNDEFFHNEVLDLLREKQEIEKELDYAVPFRVIQDFTIYKNPVNNSKRNSTMGAVIFLFTTIFVLIIIQINKKVS